MNMLFRVQMQIYLLFNASVWYFYGAFGAISQEDEHVMRGATKTLEEVYRQRSDIEACWIMVKHSQKRCVMWYMWYCILCRIIVSHQNQKNSDGQIESLLYSVMFWWFCHILSLHATVLVDLISATGLYRAWGCGSPGQIAVGQQRAWRQQRRGHGTYGTIWHQQKLTKGSLSQGLVMVSDSRWFSCPKSCRCWCYSWWVRCPADGKPGATITSNILIPTAVCQTKDVSSPIIPAISPIRISYHLSF